jgi:hypothetical protein
MANDEVAQRASEIARQRQLAAEEEQRYQEAQQREIDWQTERAEERLEAVKKHFQGILTQSTRSEVVWGDPDPDIIDEHDRTGDPISLPDVLVSATIKFWQRISDRPVLVELGELSVINATNGLRSAKNKDPANPYFIERVEGPPIRHFTYEFAVTSEHKRGLKEHSEKAWGDIPSVSVFAASVADLCMDVLALVESKGIKTMTAAQAEAEIKRANRTSAVLEGIWRVLFLFIQFGLILAFLAFFQFVIMPPLQEWVRSLGIG